MRRLMSALAGAMFVTTLVACNGGSGGVPPKQGLRDPEAFVPPNTSVARGTQTMRQIRVPKAPSDAHARRTLSTNILSDPGFESGGFASWGQCGNVNATMSTIRAHTGTYSARGGSTNAYSGEITGDAGVCQQVTIPTNGMLTFWYYGFSNETSTTYSYQEAELFNSSGVTVKMLWQAVDETNAWVQKTIDVSAYAGQTLYLYFGVHGDGYTGTYTILYVDDVTLSGGTSTPTPTPHHDADPAGHADADPGRNADADAGRDTDADAEAYCNTDAGRDTDADADADAETDGHADPCAHGDADGWTDPDPAAHRRRR